MEAPGREVALVDLSETNEEAGRDDADDLARERLFPAASEELRLEQPGEADLVGAVLDLGRGPLLLRRVLGECR